jgi:CcmD family protein
LRQSGKIYVVVLVVLIIFIGIIVYMIYLDRKMSKMEEKIKEK